MDFEGNYWHPLDKYAAMGKYLPKNIGVSTPPMKDQLEALKARVFQGAQHAELGFWNQGLRKGSMTQGSPSPEMYGKEERQAMKEMAKINKVSLSTHASPSAGNLAGLGKENFSEKSRHETVTDVKRAVDFAADVAEGGPIVVHVGEYPREAHEIREEKKGLFKGYPEAEKETIHYLIDIRTGKIISTVREDQKNYVPVWTDTQKTVWGEDLRQLETEKESGNIKIVERNWDYYMKNNENDPDKAARAFFEDTLAQRRMQAVGQANEYEIRNREMRRRAEKVRDALEKWDKYQELWEKSGKMPDVLKEIGYGAQDIRPERVPPKEYYKRLLWEMEKGISYGQETAASARAQIREYEEARKNAEPMHDFALKKTSDSLAQLGMYAMEKTRKKELEKPLFVSPELIFPEQYGGHPQELKEVVVKSRERMADMLVQKKNMSKSAAQKFAEDYIKATFDVGHANTWRRFFQGSDEDFNKWLIKQTKDLQKSGVMGHVHITDNFGYVDEHVTPGQGNVPVEDFLKELKKSGYKDKIIIEPAHQDYKAWLGALKASGSPVYRIDGATRTWTDIEGGYFGQTRSPRYIFGDYAPDQKTWTLWSEIPLE